MSQVEQLERETELTRSQIADTLDELKARMTPGQVLDQLADRLNDGAAGAFARNLKDQTVNNPLSLALIGAGLAWLMLGPRGSNGGFMRGAGARLRNAASDVAEKVRGATDEADSTGFDRSQELSARVSGLGEGAREGIGSAAERAGQIGAGAADTMRDTAGSMRDAAQQGAARTADAMRDAAGSMSDSIQRTASAGYDTITDTARRTADTLSDTTKAAGQLTRRSGSTLVDFCREQPMVVAGLGLAIGAIVGALLPTSETENQLMGEASDRVKGQAQELATEQYENAKKVGERALDAAKDETVKQAQEQGWAGGSADHKEEPVSTEAKEDAATLVPSDQAEPDAQGQPWPAKDAPV